MKVFEMRGCGSESHHGSDAREGEGEKNFFQKVLLPLSFSSRQLTFDSKVEPSDADVECFVKSVLVSKLYDLVVCV